MFGTRNHPTLDLIFPRQGTNPKCWSDQWQSHCCRPAVIHGSDTLHAFSSFIFAECWSLCSDINAFWPVMMTRIFRDELAVPWKFTVEMFVAIIAGVVLSLYPLCSTEADLGWGCLCKSSCWFLSISPLVTQQFVNVRIRAGAQISPWPLPGPSRLVTALLMECRDVQIQQPFYCPLQSPLTLGYALPRYTCH